MSVYRFSYEEPIFKNMLDGTGRYYTAVEQAEYSFLAKDDDEARRLAATFLEEKQKGLEQYIELFKSDRGEPVLILSWVSFRFQAYTLRRVTIPAVTEISERVPLVPGSGI